MNRTVGLIRGVRALIDYGWPRLLEGLTCTSHAETVDRLSDDWRLVVWLLVFDVSANYPSVGSPVCTPAALTQVVMVVLVALRDCRNLLRSMRLRRAGLRELLLLLLRRRLLILPRLLEAVLGSLQLVHFASLVLSFPKRPCRWVTYLVPGTWLWRLILDRSSLTGLAAVATGGTHRIAFLVPVSTAASHARRPRHRGVGSASLRQPKKRGKRSK